MLYIKIIIYFKKCEFVYLLFGYAPSSLVHSVCYVDSFSTALSVAFDPLYLWNSLICLERWLNLTIINKTYSLGGLVACNFWLHSIW